MAVGSTTPLFRKPLINFSKRQYKILIMAFKIKDQVWTFHLSEVWNPWSQSYSQAKQISKHQLAARHFVLIEMFWIRKQWFSIFQPMKEYEYWGCESDNFPIFLIGLIWWVWVNIFKIQQWHPLIFKNWNLHQTNHCSWFF